MYSQESETASMTRVRMKSSRHGGNQETRVGVIYSLTHDFLTSASLLKLVLTRKRTLE